MKITALETIQLPHLNNIIWCREGTQQRPKTYRMPLPLLNENGMMRYRASKLDCDACALKPRCCPNLTARKILRSIHEGARDMARDICGDQPDRRPGALIGKP
jgi:hypothetical protein